MIQKLCLVTVYLKHTLVRKWLLWLCDRHGFWFIFCLKKKSFQINKTPTKIWHEVLQFFYFSHCKWCIWCQKCSSMYASPLTSMPSLLTHAVAHSSRPSFRPKTNNQPIKKFLSLAVSWVKVVKNCKILTFKVNFLCQKLSESF